MSALEELAEKFSQEATPPDMWSQIELLQMYEAQARKVIEAMPSPYVVSEGALEDMAYMQKEMKDLARQIAKSVANPSVVVPGEVARTFLTGAYVTATWQAGMFAPEPRAALVNGGLMTDAEISEDIGRRINVLRAIAVVGNSSLLTPLYKQAADESGLKGLGLAPIVVGGVTVAAELVIAAVVLGLAVIAALAYMAVTIYLIADTNKRASKLIEQICFDESGKPYPATAEPCIKAALEMQNEAARNLAENTPDKIWDKMVLYGAIGVGVYATIVFLPDIVKSLRSAKQAATD